MPVQLTNTSSFCPLQMCCSWTSEITSRVPFSSPSLAGIDQLVLEVGRYAIWREFDRVCCWADCVVSFSGTARCDSEERIAEPVSWSGSGCALMMVMDWSWHMAKWLRIVVAKRLVCEKQPLRVVPHVRTMHDIMRHATYWIRIRSDTARILRFVIHMVQHQTKIIHSQETCGCLCGR